MNHAHAIECSELEVMFNIQETVIALHVVDTAVYRWLFCISLLSTDLTTGISGGFRHGMAVVNNHNGCSLGHPVGLSHRLMTAGMNSTNMW